jgi:CHAD domain-containing protein
MKARKVPGLDCAGTLAENAQRIVSVRADELMELGEQALDPDDEKALHDARIAAKRLRYVLEMHTPVFGGPAAKAAKEARKLQDLLGEIHDCDELLPVVRTHVNRLRAEDSGAVRGRAGTRSNELDARLARRAPHRTHYRGLETLYVYTRARREVLYARFLREWRRLQREGFRDRVEEAMGR